ncbi:hypothetical protein Q5O14_08535 [Eubacteriaceae bacterium ES2]|nr:hypothetical protein Q5O14_08535 [Eubacteriaceae bacterium ES2]
MNALIELNQIFSDLNISAETGKFSKEAPYEYLVVTPLTDDFALFGDDKPLRSIEEVRISIFCKENYNALKNRLLKSLLTSDFVITSRHYVGHEDDTGYYHYAIDVAKDYELEEN